MHDASKVYLNSQQLRARLANISDMTLWRWLHDERLGFPPPIRINRRRLWSLTDVEKWEAAQAARVAHSQAEAA